MIACFTVACHAAAPKGKDPAEWCYRALPRSSTAKYGHTLRLQCCHFAFWSETDRKLLSLKNTTLLSTQSPPSHGNVNFSSIVLPSKTFIMAAFAQLNPSTSCHRQQTQLSCRSPPCREALALQCGALPGASGPSSEQTLRLHSDAISMAI